MRPRAEEIVKQLLARTRAGAVQWELQGKYVLSATLGSYQVIVADTGSVDGTQFTFTIKRLSDSIEVDTTTGTRGTATRSDFLLLGELWKNARDQAAGVDVAFDEIEAALKSTEEIAPDDLPFE